MLAMLKQNPFFHLLNFLILIRGNGPEPSIRNTFSNCSRSRNVSVIAQNKWTGFDPINCLNTSEVMQRYLTDPLEEPFTWSSKVLTSTKRSYINSSRSNDPALIVLEALCTTTNVNNSSELCTNETFLSKSSVISSRCCLLRAIRRKLQVYTASVYKTKKYWEL